MNETRILIVGASTGVGRKAVDNALERGCSVRAMSRGAEDMAVEHQRLEKFCGDATRSEDVKGALEGVDAVVLALGIGSGLGRRMQPVTLFSRATETLVDKMAASGPRRLVVVTGFGAGDSRESMGRLEGFGHRLLLGRAYDDKDVQERIVKASGLEWTIVRPTILTNGPASGEYQVLVHPHSWRNGLVSRADVAAFLVDCALDKQYLYQSPVLAY